MKMCISSVFSDKEKVVPTNVRNVTVCNLWSLVYPCNSPSDIKYQKTPLPTNDVHPELDDSEILNDFENFVGVGKMFL